MDMQTYSMDTVICEVRKRKLQEGFRAFDEAFCAFFPDKHVTASDLQKLFFQDQKLTRHLVDLCLTIQKGSYTEYAKIYFFLRKALSTKAYHQIKNDESILETKFLHDLVIASYLRPKLLDLYAPFTKLFSQKNGSFCEKLIFSKEQAVKHGAKASAKNLSYIKKHPGMLFKAFLSTPFAMPINYITPYDPRLQFHNIAGEAFIEKFDTKNGLCRATTLYTPSPTVGTKAAPEMKAFLQACTNRKLGMWRYVNLQDCTSINERAKALAIHALADEFPEAFSCCSISQDNGLYRARPTTQEEIVALLLDSRNFSKSAKMGYYFPGNKALWQDAIPFIAREAFQITDNRRALYELVHLGIIRYFHLQNSQHAKNLILSSSCKESIDRGGKINALFLWALSDDDTKAYTAFHARALSVRSRLMQKKRFDEALIFLQHVSKIEVQSFLDKIAQRVGVSCS